MRYLMLIGFLGMLLTTFITADAFSALLDDNVVLYLPFDEGKGKVAKDMGSDKNALFPLAAESLIPIRHQTSNL